MNDDMKMILFSDLHYLDDNHKEKTNRKLTKLAVPVIEKLIYEINQKIKPDICVNLGDLIEDTEDYKQDIMNYDFAYTKLKEIMNVIAEIIAYSINQITKGNDGKIPRVSG